MKPTVLVPALLLARAACDKHASDGGAAATPPAPAATKVTEATFATPTPPAKATPAAPEPAKAEATAKAEGETCGEAAMADGTCKGEGGEMAGCNKWDEAAAAVGQRATPADAEWATIPVTGMSCGGCERRIIANLGEVDGILGVEADAELGQVRIAHARGAKALEATARAKINALGYHAN
jgi:copper chaperone CopZ